jgi:hypothetical protein
MPVGDFEGASGEPGGEEEGPIDPFDPTVTGPQRQVPVPQVDVPPEEGDGDQGGTLPPPFKTSLDRIEPITRDTQSAGYERAFNAQMDSLTEGDAIAAAEESGAASGGIGGGGGGGFGDDGGDGGDDDEFEFSLAEPTDGLMQDAVQDPSEAEGEANAEDVQVTS